MSLGPYDTKLVVGIVTYNNLPMLKRCFDSWRRVPNSHLVVFDNGSEAETQRWLQHKLVDHLIMNKTNAGLCVARNRILEYVRDHHYTDHVLLVDSDVDLHVGASALMQEVLYKDPVAGMVSFEQAIHGFPVTPDGYVEEVSNECVMSKMKMWREVGRFPEALTYYSGDSWASTMANMHGWRTKVIHGVRGYDHFSHGSHVNPGVKEAMAVDIRWWQNAEAKMVDYWKWRLEHGKGAIQDKEVTKQESLQVSNLANSATLPLDK